MIETNPRISELHLLMVWKWYGSTVEIDGLYIVSNVKNRLYQLVGR